MKRVTTFFLMILFGMMAPILVRAETDNLDTAVTSTTSDSILESSSIKESTVSSTDSSTTSTLEGAGGESNSEKILDSSEKVPNETVDTTDEPETIESSTENSSYQEVVPQYSGEDENGTYYLPRNRSDIEPGIQYRATLPRVSADNRNTPTKSFVDISSHNGNISVHDFKIMKKYGVQGVAIKLTEYTTYTNEYAQSQIANAKAAGLRVSAYHYSWFKSDAEAIQEANYFAAAAKKFGLSSDTIMVNDIEEPKILGKGNHTQNSLAFQNRLKQLGYSNVRHYVGLYWLNSGYIDSNQLGKKNIWVAAYPYSISQNNYYTQYGAWQWSAQLSFPGVSGSKVFDISADYTNAYSTNEYQIKYSSHIQSLGWQNNATNNQISGTEGSGKRLEAVKLSLANSSVGNIEYQSHIQGIGWETSWKRNGEISGTTGQGKRVEAIRIRLTGAIADRYDIYYRVHSQRFGWLNWAKNGETAGTEGFYYRMEGLQIILVPKGTDKPSGTGSAFMEFQDYDVSYQSHIQRLGWSDASLNGIYSGTIGQKLRLEAIKVKLPTNKLNISGSIEYQTHIQFKGWQSWVSNNAISGTEGQGLRVEAVKIRLTGELANHYDVYYRSHTQTYGWMGWTSNGSSSGTQGLGKRLEAIEIMVVRKNSGAPGSTNGSFVSP